MNMSLSEIASHVNGRLSGQDINISSVSIDTRTLSSGDLYLALKGLNFDGHTFINKAKAAGASAVLIENEIETECPSIIVKDSHLALAELSGAWKSKTKVKTIGITGSNGKTTVKEMTAAILAVNSNVLFTQGNLNNDIGVPLTLLKINQHHQFAVIEMGANHAGEIKYSSHYVKPDIAVITNIGPAHIEGFGSLERTAIAKGEIIGSLTPDGVAILNKDDPFFPLWLELVEIRKVITFGLDTSASISAKAIYSEIKNNEFFTHFTLITEDGEITIKLRLAGQHSVINALTAAASCVHLKINLEQIKQGLESIKPVTGRLQPLVDKQGNLFIDDTYNANPSSLKAALTVLKQCKGEPWVVLGALAELGGNSKQIHKEMGTLIKSMGIIRLFTVGEDTKYTVEAFGNGAEFFNSQEQLIKALKEQRKDNETLLIKGSRTQKMENVVAAFIDNFRR